MGEIGLEDVHPLGGKEDDLVLVGRSSGWKSAPQEPARNIFFSNIMRLIPLRRWSSSFS